MATWRDIAATEVDTGSPVTDVLATAWADNPVAIAEAATGAPVVSSAWHPYDQVEYGDGNTGIIYDFDSDGSIDDLTTPDFENGYEYKLYFDGFGNAQAAYQPVISIIDNSAAETTVHTFTADNNGALYGELTIHVPRLRRTTHFLSGPVDWGAGTDVFTSGLATITINRIRNIKIDMLTSTQGKVYMLRRANDLSR